MNYINVNIKQIAFDIVKQFDIKPCLKLSLLYFIYSPKFHYDLNY